MSNSSNKQKLFRYDPTHSYFYFFVIATVGAIPFFYIGISGGWMLFVLYTLGHYWTYRLGWKYSEHGPNFNFENKWPSLEDEDEISNAAMLFLLVSYFWPLLLVYYLGVWVLTLITGKRAKFDYDDRSDLEKWEDNRDPYERWFSETVKKQKEKETRNEK